MNNLERTVGRGTLVKQREYDMPFKGIIIRLRFVGVHSGGAACKFRIVGTNGDAQQALWIPRNCVVLMDNGQLGNQDWFWNKQKNYHKLFLAGYVEQKPAKSTSII